MKKFIKISMNSIFFMATEKNFLSNFEISLFFLFCFTANQGVLMHKNFRKKNKIFAGKI